MTKEALARTRGPMMIIVGSGRSGTSLLASMMDAHPDLSVSSESHFLPKLIEALPETLTTPNHVAHMTGLIERNQWFAEWDYDLDALRTALNDALPISRPDALRMIYRVAAASDGATRFGEKTPAYVYNISLIAEELEDARFVHIVRDGRNVALSFRDASFGADDVAHSILNWQHRVLLGHEDGMALGRDRYLEVIYEQLIAEPEEQLRRICVFLDLEFSPGMLDYYRRQGYWAPRGEESKNLGKPPTTTRHWRDQLTASEQARLQLLGEKALRTWGYEMPATPTFADRAAALRDRGRWYYYRFRSKTGLARRSRTVTGRKGDHVDVG